MNAYQANITSAMLDIPERLLQEFTLYSQYSAAAACAVNHRDDSAGKRVYCDAGNCPYLEAADTVIVDGFQGYALADDLKSFKNPSANKHGLPALDWHQAIQTATSPLTIPTG